MYKVDEPEIGAEEPVAFEELLEVELHFPEFPSQTDGQVTNQSCR